MRQYQLGRTLIETLAIVAIIGVLTVSGLHLYAKAMNNIRVNHLMEKVYLLANQIRNEEIEARGSRKAFDLPNADDTLSYGFSYDEGSSSYNKKTNTIKVVIKGAFSKKICKILTNKLNDDNNRNGLKSIEGCDLDSTNSVTFSFDSNFKTSGVN